jgi:hypothetical protein
MLGGPTTELVHLPALTLALLDRIAERNAIINPVVALADNALEQAATRDRDLAAGRPVGPLHGVPFTAKDIIETADLPTTLGMPEFAHSRPTEDATMVRRMREAATAEPLAPAARALFNFGAAAARIQTKIEGETWLAPPWRQGCTRPHRSLTSRRNGNSPLNA